MTMSKKANLFLHGTYADYTKILDTTFYTIAADGGVENALKNGIVPAAIIGDGDSMTTLPESLKKQIENITYIAAPDQDYTDFEKALTYLEEHGYDEIFVFCFEGGRIDHMLAGLSSASRFKGCVTLFSEHQRIELLEKQQTVSTQVDEIISLIPFPKANNVSTNGLEWELQNANLTLGEYISISNKAKKTEITITYYSGVLYLIRSIHAE